MSIDYKALLEEIEQQLAEIAAERAILETKETALQTTIIGLKQLVGLGTGTSSPAPAQGPTRGTIKIPADAFKGMTNIVQAAIKYLGMVGEPKKNKELVDSLIAGGFPTKAKEPYITFRSVLMRAMKEKGTFTYDNKMWGLPVWKFGIPTPNDEPTQTTEQAAQQPDVVKELSNTPAERSFLRY